MEANATTLILDQYALATAVMRELTAKGTLSTARVQTRVSQEKAAMMSVQEL